MTFGMDQEGVQELAFTLFDKIEYANDTGDVQGLAFARGRLSMLRQLATEFGVLFEEFDGWVTKRGLQGMS